MNNLIYLIASNPRGTRSSLTKFEPSPAGFESDLDQVSNMALQKARQLGWASVIFFDGFDGWQVMDFTRSFI